MRPNELEGILRDLNARSARDTSSGRSELETKLLARHERLYSRERGFIMTTIIKKPVLAVLLLAIMAVGACTVPTETEVGMGQRLIYTMDDSEMLGQIGDLVQLVKDQPGVDDVTIRVDDISGGNTVVDMVLWGHGLNPDSLTGSIEKGFPKMADASLKAETLFTEVRTSLAEKIGHNYFNFDVVIEGSDNEIKARILEQIYDSGYEGLAEVDVNTVDGVTTIGVGMTAEGDSLETVDEIVVDLINEGI